MKYQIIDTNYIRKNNTVSDYLMTYVLDKKEANKFIRAINNVNKITTETEFEFYDSFVGSDNFNYFVLENNFGCFITREDNVNIIIDDEDINIFHGIKNIVKSGDKTVLITTDNKRYMTTRDASDKDDIEKAIMILLLKKEGYTVDDIYTIIASAKDRTKKKTSKTKGVKVSTKKLKVIEETSTSETV